MGRLVTRPGREKPGRAVTGKEAGPHVTPGYSRRQPHRLQRLLRESWAPICNQAARSPEQGGEEDGWGPPKRHCGT